MRTQLIAVGVALGLALTALPADARKDIETQGPSLNGTLFQAPDAAQTGFKVEAVELPDGAVLTGGQVYARTDEEMQGPSLNGTMFQAADANSRGFEIEMLELPHGVLSSR